MAMMIENEAYGKNPMYAVRHVYRCFLFIISYLHKDYNCLMLSSQQPQTLFGFGAIKTIIYIGCVSFVREK